MGHTATMTWITAPENYVRIQPLEDLDPPEEFDEAVEFTENGKANVSEPVAQFLIDNYSEIEASETSEDN